MLKNKCFGYISPDTPSSNQSLSKSYIIAHKHKKVNKILEREEISGCPEMLCNLHPWRFKIPNLIKH